MIEKIFRKDVTRFQRLGKTLDKSAYAKTKIVCIIVIVLGIILSVFSIMMETVMTKASKRIWWDSSASAGIDFFKFMSFLAILCGIITIIVGICGFILTNNIINSCYTCPDCGGLYWYGDTSCHFCKRVLTSKQPNANLQFEQSIKKIKICPYCNKESLQDNMFCSGCGKKLP